MYIGVLAKALLMPFDNVKKRLQVSTMFHNPSNLGSPGSPGSPGGPSMQRKYKGGMDCFLQVKKEGIRALWYTTYILYHINTIYILYVCITLLTPIEVIRAMRVIMIQITVLIYIYIYPFNVLVPPCFNTITPDNCDNPEIVRIS